MEPTELPLMYLKVHQREFCRFHRFHGFRESLDMPPRFFCRIYLLLACNEIACEYSRFSVLLMITARDVLPTSLAARSKKKRLCLPANNKSISHHLGYSYRQPSFSLELPGYFRFFIIMTYFKQVKVNYAYFRLYVSLSEQQQTMSRFLKTFYLHGPVFVCENPPRQKERSPGRL